MNLEVFVLNVNRKIINETLRGIYDAILLEEQAVSMRGRSSVNDVFAQARREFNFETHLAFVDYKKAFDKVNNVASLRSYCKRLFHRPTCSKT